MSNSQDKHILESHYKDAEYVLLSKIIVTVDSWSFIKSTQKFPPKNQFDIH